MNKLFFGDNLDVMREHIKDESVDLVYLDPPFNSNANYNVLIKERSGAGSEAQAEAFRDTWGWGEAAATSYDEVIKSGGSLVPLMRALRGWLGDTSMMAYLAMMAIRLQELRRVLNSTGSPYLHCDPTASHYLKLILDGIFGPERFLNEIIWKRHSAHSSAKRYGPVHDTILYYSKSNKFIWTGPRLEYDEEYLDKYYKYDDGDGRLYWRNSLTAAGTRQGSSGKSWRGYDPASQGAHWKFTIENLDTLDAAGKIYWPPGGGCPQIKRYRDELKGLAVSDIWDDINKINPAGNERLGYPTQKPTQLLERIISASSNPDSVILDPFCGCGTSVEAAENLGRQWIGIDVTHYAITLIETRLRKTHPAAKYEVSGRPINFSGASDLARRDKHQFQWWAAWLLGAQTYETKKGADRGIDGNIYFQNGPFGFGRIIISVKGGDNLGPAMVRELSGVVQREEAEMGILVTLGEPTKAMIADAAGAGFVPNSAHGRLPRIQIATIANLLAGRMPKMPPTPHPERSVAGKTRRRDQDQLELLLPFVGEKGLPKGAILDPRFLDLAN
ncbi:MAG: DNA methyltransferase [Methylovirgula sp.]